MSNRKIHKRHFAFPGLIAITLLVPLLWAYYAFRTNEIGSYNVVNVMYSYENSNKDYGFSLHPERIFRLYNLNGNEQHDAEQLKLAQQHIRQILAVNDTLKGVHLKFGKKAKYKSFIRALDICAIENAQFYTMKGDDFWIFTMPPLKNVDTLHRIHPVLL